jgi:hypothetical protein
MAVCVRAPDGRTQSVFVPVMVLEDRRWEAAQSQLTDWTSCSHKYVVSMLVVSQVCVCIWVRAWSRTTQGKGEREGEREREIERERERRRETER